MAATTKATWFGSQLDPRNNSLNLIRLVLAFAVLIHHSWPLAGVAGEPMFAGDTLGGWAVAGFFGVSGYLITSSRLSNSLGPYLVNRIARIMPAFWVCLLSMAFVFAPIGYWAAKGNLGGFLTAPHSPVNYLISNALLDMRFHDVASTPLNVPYEGAWNGSLWSLYYEFLCYLIIAALGCFAFIRRSRWPLTVAFAASVVAQANIASIGRLTNHNFDVVMMLKLLPFFPRWRSHFHVEGQNRLSLDSRGFFPRCRSRHFVNSAGVGGAGLCVVRQLWNHLALHRHKAAPADCKERHLLRGLYLCVPRPATVGRLWRPRTGFVLVQCHCRPCHAALGHRKLAVGGASHHEARAGQKTTENNANASPLRGVRCIPAL